MVIEQSTVKSKDKQTESKVIPDDWKECNLKENTTKIGSGVTPRGGEKVYKKEGRYFIRSQNVGWGDLDLDDCVFIDEETHSSFSSTEIKIDDVLLNITGASIGRSVVADSRIEKGNVNQHVCIIRVDSRKLNPYFLNKFLLSKSGQKQINIFQAGGNREGLNFGQIGSIKILYPKDIQEQKNILKILLDVDKLINTLKKLIIKKRNVQEGVKQELLTGKKRFKGFHTTWKLTTLGKIFHLKTGTSKSNYIIKSGKYIIMDMGSVSEYGKNISIKQTNFKGDFLKIGDLVMPKDDIGTGKIIGKTVFIDENEKYVLGDHVYALQTKKDEIDSKFISYLINSFPVNLEILKNVTGSAQLGINKKSIEKQEITIPLTKEEQLLIANVLSDMDLEIQELEQKRDKYIKIKNGMMQKLLTGEIRLV